MQMTGAQILVQALLDMGTEVVFGYPGGGALNIYDALYERRDELRHVLASHEQGATHAADGYARSTGKTGVVIATSGPGATNLVTGIATAFHDSVPLVAITGNVTLDLIGRDSFQEVDIVGITNPITKHNYIVKDVTQLAQTVREAFVIANSGRKGPVLIDVPKDISAMKTEFTPLAKFQPRKQPPLNQKSLDAAIQTILNAKRPLIYVGGGVVFSDASEPFCQFAKKIDAPVCSSMMGLSAMRYDAPGYLGLIGMHGTAPANWASTHCDLLIAVGARFSDRVAGNRELFAEDATILHIDIDASEISKNVRSQLSVIGDANEILKTLTDAIPTQSHKEWIQTLEDRKQRKSGLPPAQSNGAVNPRDVILKVHEIWGDDAIIVTDVGQHQMYTAQYYPFTKPRTFISSCGLGTMGYGLGAAIGSQVGNPDRPVVLISGDGSFHMNLNELAVAVSEKLPVTAIVLNNSVLGMVHQWQKLFYAERYSASEINRKTDYVKLAEAFGASGYQITTPQEIDSILRQAHAATGPCVIECVIPSTEGVYPIIPPSGTQKDMIFKE